MSSSHRLATIGSCLVAATAAWSTHATPQDFPQRPIRLVVAVAAGGTTDIMGRLVGARLSQPTR